MIAREDLLLLVKSAQQHDGHERTDAELAAWWDQAIAAEWHYEPARRVLRLLTLTQPGLIRPEDITTRLAGLPSRIPAVRRSPTAEEAARSRANRMTLREHAQTVACPCCGSEIGEPCRGMYGEPKRFMDCVARVAVADAALPPGAWLPGEVVWPD